MLDGNQSHFTASTSSAVVARRVLAPLPGGGSGWAERDPEAPPLAPDRGGHQRDAGALRQERRALPCARASPVTLRVPSKKMPIA